MIAYIWIQVTIKYTFIGANSNILDKVMYKTNSFKTDRDKIVETLKYR